MTKTAGLDNLVQVMSRCLRINGATTRDTLFRDDILSLNEQLAVTLNKSQLIPSEKLEELRDSIATLKAKIARVRREEGF
jgi:hypothetical protein